MIDEFDVDISRGQAIHRPTKHVVCFRPSKPVDEVEITVWRANREIDRSPLEILQNASEAIRLAMRHAGYH
jgi:hypothetical protein